MLLFIVIICYYKNVVSREGSLLKTPTELIACSVIDSKKVFSTYLKIDYRLRKLLKVLRV